MDSILQCDFCKGTWKSIVHMNKHINKCSCDLNWPNFMCCYCQLWLRESKNNLKIYSSHLDKNVLKERKIRENKWIIKNMR